MKITCLVLCFLGLAALVVADAGFFVPKAFYKLDAEGHKSNVYEINPREAILKRLGRQVSSSSSSSSTTFSNGGRGVFEQHQQVLTSPGLQSRFSDDDDEPSYFGHAIHSTGVIENGRVVYHDTKHQKL